jgi:hypothetical protein
MMVYTSPKHQFDPETEKNLRVQIDNSLDLGWDPKDILLYTNFDYERNGVKSIVVPDIYQHHMDHTSNKVPVIAWLIENGLPDELYWVHDIDAFQELIFEPPEVTKDIALAKYGYKDEWQCGSIFFKPSPFWAYWNEEMKRRKRTRTEEKVLLRLTKNGLADPQEIDVSYNLTFKFLHRTYKEPPKVLHFHPNYKDETISHRALDLVKGKNKLGVQIISDRLLAIFKKHGIE